MARPEQQELLLQESLREFESLIRAILKQRQWGTIGINFGVKAGHLTHVKITQEQTRNPQSET